VTKVIQAQWPAVDVKLARSAVFSVGLVLVATLLVLPVAVLVGRVYAGGLAGFWETIASPEALFSLRFTLSLAAITTLINAFLGTLVATMLVRHEFPLKGLVYSLVELPLAVPAVVTGVTVVLLYGPMGPLGGLADDARMDPSFALPLILIAHVLLTLPLTVRAVGPALRRLDRRQEEAARTMGAGGFRVLLSVVLPAIKGGLISGCMFTFARSLGEFGATVMVSASLALGTQTAPLFIFSEFSRGSIQAASAMAIVLVGISTALFFGSKAVAHRWAPGEVAGV
jgi:sulfate ABC transporter permease subunit